MADASFDEARRRLGDDAAGTAVFTDFDGTLSAIVDDPASAVPLPGAVAALDALAGRVGRVGVLSGRPVDFLRSWLPPTLVLAGLYGLEVLVDGERRDHPSGGVWRQVVDDVAAQSAARGPDGMRVEAKGLSLTLHYRGRPDIEPAVRAWAGQQAARSGLEVRPARMSVELHPPIEVDKGTTLVDLAQGCSAVCFLGDDVGDLPAFDGLDRLAAAGVATLRVAVRSTEGSPDLLDRADLVVDGPPGALALIEALACG
jgi:trehalose 6-phosphate phosphatase